MPFCVWRGICVQPAWFEKDQNKFFTLHSIICSHPELLFCNWRWPQLFFPMLQEREHRRGWTKYYIQSSSNIRLFLDAFQFNSLPSRSHDFKTFNIYDWHFSQTELTCERKVFATLAIFCIFARLIQIGTGFVTILVIHLADPQDQDSPWMNTRTGSSVGDRSISAIFSSSSVTLFLWWSNAFLTAQFLLLGMVFLSGLGPKTPEMSI